jgi:hypothetical protein
MQSCQLSMIAPARFARIVHAPHGVHCHCILRIRFGISALHAGLQLIVRSRTIPFVSYDIGDWCDDGGACLQGPGASP